MPDEKDRNEFFEFLRFGSISTDSKYQDEVRACAGWLERKLGAIGLKTSQHETPGNPIVVGRGPRSGATRRSIR
jgi:acetylornithine deacetylase/succinyl-diaminopimelate desuccinylase-like protein